MNRFIYLLAFLICFVYLPVGTGGAPKKSVCPKIKLKRQWGGKAATGINYLIRPVPYAIVHHTVSKECDNFLECAELLQGMQQFHQKSLKYYDIAYNFLIGNDGIVYEGTGWGIRGAHTYGYNSNSTGIAFIGNFQAKLPSKSALKAAKKLLNCGVEKGELQKGYMLLGGTQVSQTKSPGLTLYNEIQEWDHWTLNP